MEVFVAIENNYEDTHLICITLSLEKAIEIVKENSSKSTKWLPCETNIDDNSWILDGNYRNSIGIRDNINVVITKEQVYE